MTDTETMDLAGFLREVAEVAEGRDGAWPGASASEVFRACWTDAVPYEHAETAALVLETVAGRDLGEFAPEDLARWCREVGERLAAGAETIAELSGEYVGARTEHQTDEWVLRLTFEEADLVGDALHFRADDWDDYGHDLEVSHPPDPEGAEHARRQASRLRSLFGRIVPVSADG